MRPGLHKPGPRRAAVAQTGFGPARACAIDRPPGPEGWGGRSGRVRARQSLCHRPPAGVGGMGRSLRQGSGPPEPVPSTARRGRGDRAVAQQGSGPPEPVPSTARRGRGDGAVAQTGFGPARACAIDRPPGRGMGRSLRQGSGPARACAIDRPPGSGGSGGRSDRVRARQSLCHRPPAGGGGMGRSLRQGSGPPEPAPSTAHRGRGAGRSLRRGADRPRSGRRRPLARPRGHAVVQPRIRVELLAHGAHPPRRLLRNLARRPTNARAGVAADRDPSTASRRGRGGWRPRGGRVRTASDP